MLSHLRVIDLSRELGRYTAKLLADLGADVVRVVPADGEVGSLAWDTGKRVLTTDGAELRELLAAADILIRSDADEPYSHSDLAAMNPKLIDVVVEPFSAVGDSVQRPATDLTLMARSGLMAIVGDPDRAPMTLPGEQAYALAGAQGAVAVLTALHARALDGKGQLVRVSALQSAVLANYREPLMWQFAGRIGKRTGNLLVRGKSGVRQVWSCADGYVTWSLVDNPGMMRAMAKLMGDQGTPTELMQIDWENTLVADTPRETLVRWEGHIETFFRRNTRRQLATWSVAHGLGLSPVDEIDDVLGSEHLASRSMWRDVRRTDGSTVRVPGPLFVTTDAAGDRS